MAIYTRKISQSINHFYNCFHVLIKTMLIFSRVYIDCEQSLKERGWGNEGLKTIQEEMKYASPHNAKFPLVEIQVSVNQTRYTILDCEHSLKERRFWYEISCWIGGGINFDQWEFYVVWATRLFHFFLCCLQFLFDQWEFYCSFSFSSNSFLFRPARSLVQLQLIKKQLIYRNTKDVRPWHECVTPWFQFMYTYLRNEITLEYLQLTS